MPVGHGAVCRWRCRSCFVFGAGFGADLLAVVVAAAAWIVHTDLRGLVSRAERRAEQQRLQAVTDVQGLGWFVRPGDELCDATLRWSQR